GLCGGGLQNFCFGAGKGPGPASLAGCAVRGLFCRIKKSHHEAGQKSAYRKRARTCTPTARTNAAIHAIHTATRCFPEGKIVLINATRNPIAPTVVKFSVMMESIFTFSAARVIFTLMRLKMPTKIAISASTFPYMSFSMDLILSTFSSILVISFEREDVYSPMPRKSNSLCTSPL